MHAVESVPNFSFSSSCQEVLANYHHEMIGADLEERFEHKLLPNLPTGAAIVMDNAPDHSIKTKELRAPILSARKAEMQAWLTNRGIPWTVDMLKNELYDLLKRTTQNRSAFAIVWRWSKALSQFACLPTIAFSIRLS